MRLASTLAFCLFATGAWAQNVQSGRSTTFDSTSLGGGWSCYGPPGSCGAGTFANSFDAACAGGSTSNATALAAWWTYGHSLGTTQAKLRIPAGAVCSFGTNQSLVCDTINDDASTLIKNPLIWGYGAFWDRMQLGGNGFLDTGLGFSSALINTVSAGASRVTVNDGNASLFSVGDWIIVAALAGQISGFGPTHQFHEHALITGKSGNDLTLSAPLKNSYKQYYPQYSTGNSGTVNQGGPATIYRMANCFNTTATYLGLTLTDTVPQNNMTGREVTLQDMDFSKLGPGALVAGYIIHSRISTIEVDKDTDFLQIVKSNITFQLGVQSASTTPIEIIASRINEMLGTGENTTILGSVIAGDFMVGATCCGVSSSLTLNNVFYGNGRTAGQKTPKGSFTWNGTNAFTTNLAGMQNQPANFPGILAPGHTYFFSDSSGDAICTPTTYFTILDIVDVAGVITITVVPSWGAASLPAVVCNNEGGIPYSNYSNYKLNSLSETNVTHTGTTLGSIPGIVAP